MDLSQKWHGPGGCSEVLRLALPLIVSIGAQSIQMFVDRMFLTWYSADAMSAAMQAGIASFGVASLFLGIVSYSNTFVSQYTGAGRHNRTGPAVWQGIYCSLFVSLTFCGDVFCSAATIWIWIFSAFTCCCASTFFLT